MKMPGLVLCSALLTVSPLYAASQQHKEGNLSAFYSKITTDSENGQPPGLEAVTDKLDKISGMDVAEIQSALPAIQKAVESSNEHLSSYGMLGLYAIDQRQDSASLIGHMVPVIARKVDDPYVSALSFMTLSGMKPKPPEEAIKLILEALQSGKKLHFDKNVTNRGVMPADTDLGPGLVFALIQIDGNREDFMSAIDAYMRTKLETDDQKVSTLNALATKRITDKRLVSDVIANLSEKSVDVRVSAIHVLEKSGPNSLKSATPQLEKLAGPGEPSETVRGAASHALAQASRVNSK